MTDLVMQRYIDAPPETVFAFLVEPDKLVRWLGVSADLEPHVGGKIRVDVTGGDVTAGTYVEISAPNRVAFTWGWMGSTDVPPGSSTVTFDLVADGKGTALTLTHSGLPVGEDDSHAAGWTYFLARLRSGAAGNDPGSVSRTDLGATVAVLQEET